MKRIFIALKVEAGETLLSMIASFKTGLNNEVIKWTHQENIHITLAFLGDTDEKKIDEIKSMLSEKCTGSGKFELMLKGAGVFRNLNDPRIIWIGIESSGNLNHLNEMVKNGLDGLNIKLEDRPFNPHLTIGRIKHLKDHDSLTSLIEHFRNTEIQIVPVKEIILYENILLQSGPVYKPLAKFTLQPRASSRHPVLLQQYRL